MSDLRSPRKYKKPKKSNLVTNDTTFETQGFISIIESLTRYFELCLEVCQKYFLSCNLLTLTISFSGIPSGFFKHGAHQKIRNVWLIAKWMLFSSMLQYLNRYFRLLNLTNMRPHFLFLEILLGFPKLVEKWTTRPLGRIYVLEAYLHPQHGWYLGVQICDHSDTKCTQSPPRLPDITRCTRW